MGDERITVTVDGETTTGTGALILLKMGGDDKERVDADTRVTLVGVNAADVKSMLAGMGEQMDASEAIMFGATLDAAAHRIGVEALRRYASKDGAAKAEAFAKACEEVFGGDV